MYILASNQVLLKINFLGLSNPGSREVLIVIEGTAWYVFSLPTDHSAPLLTFTKSKQYLTSHVIDNGSNERAPAASLTDPRQLILPTSSHSQLRPPTFFLRQDRHPLKSTRRPSPTFHCYKLLKRSTISDAIIW